MAGLDSSWNLVDRLKAVECAEDLREQITEFINKMHDTCTGQRMSYSNIMYRSNLHYIEDNISKPKLVEELRILNRQIDESRDKLSNYYKDKV